MVNGRARKLLYLVIIILIGGMIGNIWYTMRKSAQVAAREVLMKQDISRMQGILAKGVDSALTQHHRIELKQDTILTLLRKK